MNMILCNYEEKEKNIIMAKIGFDLEKYLRLQSERILERVHTFGGKLYLEFGGKLFDDYHASRVLPGFLPDSKMKVLLQLKDPAVQLEAARRVAKSSLTVRQTEALVAKLLAPEPKPATGREELPQAYRDICEQLSGDFGTKVNISFRGKSNGIIEIPYTGKEDLVRILQIFGISASL